MTGKPTSRQLHPSAHQDTFARDHLPPPHAWPELVFDLPELQYPDRLNCAGELLDRRLETGDGNRVALRAPWITWTYEDLHAHATRIAHVLRDDMGLVPGNRVLLHGPNTPMLAAAWFAVQKAGGVAVSTMSILRAADLRKVIEKARVTHALCDERCLGELELARRDCPWLDRVLTFTPDGGELARRAADKPASFENVDTAADDVCLIAFTSGTTGQPKGCMHFHRDVLAICDTFARHVLKADPDDVFIGSPPLAFTFGLGGLLLFPVRIGASSVLLEKTAPPQLLAGIRDFRATVCFTAPTSYRAMAATGDRDAVRSLRKCVSAGEVLPAATREQWRIFTGIEMIDGIGATEMLHIFISADEHEARAGCTGKPVPGFQAVVLDDAGQPLPPGRVGRLAVRGPTGCRYLDDERQGQYVQRGWNVTGDAYVMTDDGYFSFQARTDDMIISSGYNIAGPEVEAALLLHPAVAECAVVGIPDELRGQVVKACVVLHAGTPATDDLKRELQQFVKDRIAPYKYPRVIEFRDALPKTPTGKLQRYQLRVETA